MEIRKGANAQPLRPALLFVPLLPVICCATALVMAGCGAPGEPVPPSPPIPVAVSDLSARQVGDSVVLTFTPPKKSTRGDRLADMPTLEVLRGSLGEDGRPQSRSFRLVDTVPGTILTSYVQQGQGKVEFPEPIAAREMRATPAGSLAYRVRTRLSERKPSADSNTVTVDLYPVPQAIGTIDTRLTENGIQLKWAAPTRTSTGEPFPGVQEYHVYRGELEPDTAESASKDLRQAKWKLALLQVATTTAPEYEDRGFDYGKTYAYVVRSAVPAAGSLLESGDSKASVLTPVDTFPPAAPQGLVAALLPGASAGTYVADLSWSINVETDLAGYRVYRSGSEESQGQLVTPELLLTPAYRDTSVQHGDSYWYRVTAVDRAGNESALSQAVAVEIPQPSQ